MNLRVNELPLSFLDGRQQWVQGAKTLEDLDIAFQEWKGTFPYFDEGFTRIKDYDIPAAKAVTQEGTCRRSNHLAEIMSQFANNEQ
jgi:hypothetical protein